MALNKYIIERDIPEVGTLERQQLAEAADRQPDIHDRSVTTRIAHPLHKHAEISGFPATKVTAIGKMIDPTTEKTG